LTGIRDDRTTIRRLVLLGLGTPLVLVNGRRGTSERLDLDFRLPTLRGYRYE
jgi:hypothetical protein